MADHSFSIRLFAYIDGTTVADPGFSPGGGGANSQNCYYFSHFCRKLHENERIWTPGGGGGGGRASLATPLGSANVQDTNEKIFLNYVTKQERQIQGW